MPTKLIPCVVRNIIPLECTHFVILQTE
jgi:hypothetical protein